MSAPAIAWRLSVMTVTRHFPAIRFRRSSRISVATIFFGLVSLALRSPPKRASPMFPEPMKVMFLLNSKFRSS